MYLTIVKTILSFMWKFKTIFLLIGLISTLYFGYQYITKVKNELRDTKNIAEVTIKEHDKMINSYNETNEELKKNEEIKFELEKINSTLKKKLEAEYRKRGQNENWGNTPIPDSVRLLLQQGPQEP